ncbi:hypothetical protein D1872_37580 [compost metagenome]
MGIFRDVADTIVELNQLAKNSIAKGDGKQYRSLSKRSMEGTLQFPVLVSKSMDIDTLQIITKALERQFSSFIQIAVTMSPELDVDRDVDAIGYLRKFHQNSNVKTDFQDVINFNNSMGNVSESLEFVASLCEGSTGRIISDNKRQLSGILEHMKTDILNNKFIPQQARVKFTSESLNNYHNTIVREAKDDDTKSSQHRQEPSMRGKLVSDRILRDNDVRKANELVPTTLHLRVIRSKGDSDQGHQDFIIGIKSTMHPIASDEIVNNLLNGLRNRGAFFNFVRWTTGEISFFKDFLFNIRSIKDDVVNRSNGASPWWISLKRRKTLARTKFVFQTKKQILPNASIVISMEEAEAIRSQYGFNLMNPAIVSKVMDTYFLLSFVIVDNSAQIAHFMFDGLMDYQSISFGGLEKENSSKSDLRDVMKIIDRSKMI